MSDPFGWIGVDLDRTLAHYERHPDGYDPFRIGAPIQKMVDRIKHWVEIGQEVRIFTARVSGFENSSAGHTARADVIEAIQDWLEFECELPRLDVTCVKDFRCIQIWDDIAVSMNPNTGDPHYHPEISVRFD